MKTTYALFDASAYLDNDAVVAEYLTAAAEDPNPDVFLAALGDVAKAWGMARIAKDTGFGRESLYKALSAGAHPRYETVSAVLRALGVKFTVVIDHRRPRAPSSRRKIAGPGVIELNRSPKRGRAVLQR
jgi:probable addiction module antidote protein